jgi:hypothetical protein
MSDLWTFGEPKGDMDVGLPAYVMGLIGGAPVSMVFEWRKAAEKAVEGDFMEAVRYGFPVKFIADTAAARINSQKDKEYGMLEAVLNPLGFRGARQAERGREFGTKRRAREQKQKQFTKMRSEFYATADKSKGEKARMTARNREWNKSAPQGLKLPTNFENIGKSRNVNP